MAEQVRIRGMKELDRSFRSLRKEALREMRPALRAAGNLVRTEAFELFSHYDPRSAAGFKVRVRQRGVAVEQSMHRTTGDHPEFGALQMRRALLPALEDKGEQVRGLVDVAITKAINKEGL